VGGGLVRDGQLAWLSGGSALYSDQRERRRKTDGTRSGPSRHRREGARRGHAHGRAGGGRLTMCGVCGFVGRAGRPLIDAMTEVLAHGGPDGDGVQLFPPDDGGVPAALGHRRLSILDTSARGAQPMAYARDRYWITYNGELYNFRELRAELEAEGLEFASDCD